MGAALGLFPDARRSRLPTLSIKSVRAGTYRARRNWETPPFRCSNPPGESYAQSHGFTAPFRTVPRRPSTLRPSIWTSRTKTRPGRITRTGYVVAFTQAMTPRHGRSGSVRPLELEGRQDRVMAFPRPILLLQPPLGRPPSKAPRYGAVPTMYSGSGLEFNALIPVLPCPFLYFPCSSSLLRRWVLDAAESTMAFIQPSDGPRRKLTFKIFFPSFSSHTINRSLFPCNYSH